MKGKSIYLSSKEIELINSIFDYGNASFEGSEDREEKEKIRESILNKTRSKVIDDL